MNVKRRPYNSPQRTERSNATRRQILSAATDLFASRGFASVTMAEIARSAEVSLATVYLYFPGKTTIVAAMVDAIAGASDLSVEQVERQSDPVQQLRVGVQIIRTLNERSWLVADILRRVHVGDADLTETWKLWQQRHLDAVRRGIMAIAAQRGLRDGLEPDEAVDAFYALAGTDVYRLLVRERGWSPDHYERWLFGLACRELLGIIPGEG